MDNNILLILEKIKQYQTIICLRHINPDGDAYGSSMGIAQFIKDNFPNKRVLVDGKDVSYLDFLGKSDKVSKEDYKDALIFVLDTNNIERIDSKYFNLGKEIIKIDHHPEYNHLSINYANIKIVDSSCISNCQLLTRILIKTGLKISKKCARFLYTGLITDSNRFLYKMVNFETFDIASYLIKTGINISNIYQNLYLRNFDSLLLDSYFISKIRITKTEIGYIKLIKEEIIKKKLSKEEIKSKLFLMSNIKEIKIWFIAFENLETGLININLRSSNYIVNEVAKKYNGGGHKLASGAKIKSWTVLKSFINDLEKCICDNNLFKIE